MKGGKRHRKHRYHACAGQHCTYSRVAGSYGRGI